MLVLADNPNPSLLVCLIRTIRGFPKFLKLGYNVKFNLSMCALFPMNTAQKLNHIFPFWIAKSDNLSDLTDGI